MVLLSFSTPKRSVVSLRGAKGRVLSVTDDEYARISSWGSCVAEVLDESWVKMSWDVVWYNM